MLMGSFSTFNRVLAEETVYEQSKQGKVNSDNVNVRTGPGTSYDATKIDGKWVYLNTNQEVTVLGEDKDGSGHLWYKVRFTYNGNEYERWVYGDYVDIIETPQPGGNEQSEFPKQAIIIDSDVRVRTGPGTNYAQFKIDGKNQYFIKNETVTVLAEALDKDGDSWYKVSFVRSGKTYTQYVFAQYAQIIMEVGDDSDFEAYMTAQGFPDSYKDKLRQLHALHPNWKFVGYKTGYSWETVVNYESRLGYSLIQTTNKAYLNVAEGSYDIKTKKFKVFDGSSWYAANKQTVGYYIDPRNFLNEINIFMFLNLSFKETETAATVQKLLKNTFMKGTDEKSGKTYAQIFYEAGKASKASPIYLAVLARQEQGNNGSRAITGGSFTYNGKTYSGLYNFFNIGATSGPDNWKKGLIYANGGERGKTLSTSYGRPWNTVEKAIKGGAKWIAEGYINVGQDTMYFQKFNVTKKNTFGHQYMTNIQSPYSQSSSMYNTYKAAKALDQELVFTIPIYNKLPVRTELPTTYKLPTTVEEQRAMASANPVIEPDPEPEPVVLTGDFITDMNLTAQEGYITGFGVGTTYNELKEQLSSVSETTQITVRDTEGTEIGGKTVLASGQTIEIRETDGTGNYTIIIRGDINGDGLINTRDLVLVKKDILGLEKLEGIGLKAGLMKGESTVSLKIYAAIKKHILGLASVPQ